MPPQKSLGERVEEFRRDLDTIQMLMDQLKREYDLYFAGARKRQPFDLKMQLERMMRKWRTTNIQKLELTFRLNTLQSRYAALTDVWDKIFKRREKDPRAITPFGPSAAQIAAAMQADRAPTPAEKREQARESSTAKRDPEARMQRLFDDFVDAKRDMGETSGMSYDKFRAQLEKQTSAIRDRTQCKDVKFQVVRKGGKVSLTAKPVRD